MPIRAQAADGSIHEFPDGTRPEVVDRAMKAYAARPSSPTEAGWQKAIQGIAPAFGLPGQAVALAARRFPREAAGIAQQIAQGVTFGGADEVASAISAIPAAVRGGAPAARQQFTQAQREQRASREDFARRNPALNAWAQGSGMALSAAVPVGAAGRFVAAAPTLGGAALRSGLVGAATGAGQGFLSADEGERMAGAAGGALAGGALGAAIPGVASVARGVAQRVAPVAGSLMSRAAPAVDELGQAIPGVGDLAGNVSMRMRAMAPEVPPIGDIMPNRVPPPPNELASQIKAAEALKRAIERDRAMGIDFTPGENPMYRGGPNLAGVYEAAAQYPGAAQVAIQRAAAKGQSDIAEGVAEDVGRALGAKGDFFSYQNNLIETQRRNAREGMEKLGNQLVTLDENSVLALRSDGARNALMKAAGNMRMSIDPDVRSQANDLMQVLDRVFDKPSGATITVRDSQNITQKLLAAADQAFKSGDNDTGIALKGLGRAIRDNSRDPRRGGFSEYDDWLRQYGMDADNRKALELGKDVLNTEWPESVQMDLADMEPSALAHYQKGVGEAVRNAIRKPNGEVATMRKLLRDRNIQEKLRIAFPDDDSFDAFIMAAEQRVSDAERNAALLQGSPTARRRAAQEDLESGGKGFMQLLGAGLEGLLSPQSIPGNAARAVLRTIPKQARGVLSDPVASEALGRTALDPQELPYLLQLLEARQPIIPRPSAPNPFAFTPPAPTPSRQPRR